MVWLVWFYFASVCCCLFRGEFCGLVLTSCPLNAWFCLLIILVLSVEVGCLVWLFWCVAGGGFAFVWFSCLVVIELLVYSYLIGLVT